GAGVGVGGEGIALAAEDVAEHDRGIDFGGGVGRFVADVELLLEDGLGAFELVGFDGALAETGERETTAADVAGARGDDVGGAEELVALAARVLLGEETVEAEGGIDDLAIEALGAGGGVAEAGEDDGVLAVVGGALGDLLIEDAKILVGEGVEDGGMPDLVEGALDGAPALDDLAGDLDDRAGVAVLTAAGAEPFEEFRHQACSSSIACLRPSRVRLPPLRMAATFLPDRSCRIW